MQAALFLAQHLVVLALLAATAWAAGTRIATRLGEPWAAVPIGLALLGQLASLLGIAGLLFPGVVIAAMVGCLLLARLPRSPFPGGRAAVLALVAGAPFLVAALYPPTVWDETMYHLPYARAFAATGGMPFLADLRFPIFPQLAEALDAAVLVLAGDVATHLVGFCAVLATAGWLWSAGGRRAGAWAALTWLGCPIVAYLAGTDYVEPMLSLFGLGAVLAVERWGEARSPGWLALAGLFAGSAASTKYLGLFFVGAVGLEVAWRGRRLRPILVYAVAAAVACAPAYLRLLCVTGNPVFPFATSIFGPNAWDSALIVLPRGLERPLAAATLLFDVVFRRGTVGWMPPYSPAIALGVPLIVWRALRDPRVRRLGLYAAVFILAAPIEAHYLLTVAPILCLAIGLSLAPFARARRRWAALAAALFLPGWLYAGFLCWQRGPLPVDDAGRAAYLARTFPLYPAVACLGHTHPDEAVYGYHAENMVVFAPGRWLGDFNGPAAYARIDAVAGRSDALARELRALGVRHLLFPNRALAVSPADFDLEYVDPVATVVGVRDRSIH